MITFEPFPKMARFSRDVIVTEKLDGTNAQVIIEPWTGDEAGAMTAAVYQGQRYYVSTGSRTRLITPGKNTDNYGFAQWVVDNADELVKLGPGRHFGEWWGQGIQRAYGLTERRFSLFNVTRWEQAYNAFLLGQDSDFPECCGLVPTLYRGPLDHPFISNTKDGPSAETPITAVMNRLEFTGSHAAPGFMKPEGIVIYHTAAHVSFKKTFDKDDTGKEEA